MDISILVSISYQHRHEYCIEKTYEDSIISQYTTIYYICDLKILINIPREEKRSSVVLIQIQFCFAIKNSSSTNFIITIYICLIRTEQMKKRINFHLKKLESLKLLPNILCSFLDDQLHSSYRRMILFAF